MKLLKQNKIARILGTICCLGVISCLFIILRPTVGVTDNRPDLGLTWSRLFKRSGHQGASALIQTEDGGYALGGTSNEYWLIKTDAEGIEQWNTSYKCVKTPSSGFSYLTNLIQTPDGGFALIGATETSTDWDVWLVKTNANGTEVWNQTYDGPENHRDYAASVCLTPDEGYLIGAFTRDPETTEGNPLFDYWLIKTDVNGTKQWDKIYAGLGNDESFDLIPTQDGNYLFGGVSAPSRYSTYKTWFVKVNSSGTVLWEKYYNASTSLIVLEQGLLETDDGGFLIAGYTTTSDDWWRAGNDYHIIKTTATGEVEWSQEFGGDYSDVVLTGLQSKAGNYYIGGTYATTRYTSGEDMCLVKLSNTGEILWNLTYGEPSARDYIADMVQAESSDSTDTLVVLGAFDEEIWLGKFETKDPTPTTAGISTTITTTTTTIAEDFPGFELGVLLLLLFLGMVYSRRRRY